MTNIYPLLWTSAVLAGVNGVALAVGVVWPSIYFRLATIFSQVAICCFLVSALSTGYGNDITDGDYWKTFYTGDRAGVFGYTGMASAT